MGRRSLWRRRVILPCHGVAPLAGEDGSKRIFIKLTCAVLTTLALTNTALASHDETKYGKALPYYKVDDVGPCMDAEVVGNRLYAIGEGKLYVLDIADPLKPKLMGKLSDLGFTRQIVIKGTTAFITSRQDGLWIVDISNDKKPALISHYDTVEMATGIWVSGDLAYVATRCYGVETVDVSDLHNPRHVSMLKTGEAQSCWARDNLLYIGDWHPKKLIIADMKNPRKPEIIGEAEIDGYGDGGCLRGNICYAGTGHHSRNKNKTEANGAGHGLDLFDVSNPKQPKLLSRVKFPRVYCIYNDMWCARVAGNYCVVADTWNGLFVVDVKNPNNASIVAHAQLPMLKDKDQADPIAGIALTKDVIYAAGIYTGLYVVPAPGMSSPVIPEKDSPPVLKPRPKKQEANPDFLVYRPEGQVSSIDLQGDVAWLSCGHSGIHAVKLTDKVIKPLTTHKGKDDVSYINLCGDLLYAAENKEGMAIYKIGKDYSLTEIGRLRMKGLGVKQIVVPEPGNFGLMHCGGAIAYVIDLRDKSNPKMVLQDGQVGLFYGDQFVDKLYDSRYLVAHWHRSGPAWYDISGDKPVLAHNTPATKKYSWTDGACAYGNDLLITKQGKYKILKSNDQRNADELPSYGVKGLYLHGVPTVNGNTLVITSRHMQSVDVLDITDITNPQLKHQYKLTGHPGVCRFWKGKLLIPAAYQGLLLER
ncbi:MAG: hypothetical protein PF904_03030 [Kiritimatiellae bacterium]|nr:hypothetical protein [Kiritimatiellia bacterium]